MTSGWKGEIIGRWAVRDDLTEGRTFRNVIRSDHKISNTCLYGFVFFFKVISIKLWEFSFSILGEMKSFKIQASSFVILLLIFIMNFTRHANLRNTFLQEGGFL